MSIVLERRCAFKRKPCKLCGKPMSNAVHKGPAPACRGQKQRGCARCGGPKNDAGHLGTPDSFNVMAGRDPNVYRGMIEQYRDALARELEKSGLPRGLWSIHVEAEVSFGDAVERDQGNYRVLPEKALGDALEGGSTDGSIEGGWLPSDSWGHYTFGNLDRVEAGKNRIVLTLFPAWPPEGQKKPDPLTEEGVAPDALF